MFLSKIISSTLQQLEYRKQAVPLTKIRQMALDQCQPLDLASAIKGNGIKLIAELKKASPSKGIICYDFNPLRIAEIYADNGAAAISVLTEDRYFCGSLDHLRTVKASLIKRLPLIRKDFILDPYQVYESRAYGADSLLLIVAILTPAQLLEFINLSSELGMSCLVEVHNETELDIALKSGAKIIGINNRDLQTFNISLSTTERLRPLIPPDRLVVSESGIKMRSDIERLEKLGVNAVLVGEALVAASDITAKMKELLGK